MSKGKRFFFIGLAIAAMFLTGCGNDSDSTPTDEPTAEVITGEETLDEIITETQDAVSTTVSALCSLCRFNESGDDGDMSKCDNACK